MSKKLVDLKQSNSLIKASNENGEIINAKNIMDKQGIKELTLSDSTKHSKTLISMVEKFNKVYSQTLNLKKELNEKCKVTGDNSKITVIAENKKNLSNLQNLKTKFKGSVCAHKKQISEFKTLVKELKARQKAETNKEKLAERRNALVNLKKMNKKQDALIKQNLKIIKYLTKIINFLKNNGFNMGIATLKTINNKLAKIILILIALYERIVKYIALDSRKSVTRFYKKTRLYLEIDRLFSMAGRYINSLTLLCKKAGSNSLPKVNNNPGKLNDVLDKIISGYSTQISVMARRITNVLNIDNLEKLKEWTKKARRDFEKQLRKLMRDFKLAVLDGLKVFNITSKSSQASLLGACQLALLAHVFEDKAVLNLFAFATSSTFSDCLVWAVVDCVLAVLLGCLALCGSGLLFFPFFSLFVIALGFLSLILGGGPILLGILVAVTAITVASAIGAITVGRAAKRNIENYPYDINGNPKILAP